MTDEQTGPETQTHQEVDVNELGEAELEQVEVVDGKAVIKSQAPPPSPASEQDGGTPPVDEKKTVEAKKEPDEGKQPPTPGEEGTPASESTPPPQDDIDGFLEDMKSLKAKSEKEHSDEYAKRVESLKKSDPVRARLWETHNRNIGLQQGFQKERMSRRQYEKEVAALKAKQVKASVEGFEELSEEELTELKENDPDAYADYKIQKNEFERRKEDVTKGEISERQTAQLGELSDFLFTQFGFELGPETKGELDKVFPQTVSTQVDTELERIFGKDTLYTAEQIALVYNHVMKDEILKQERIKARAGLKESIEAAELGGSRLDKLPPGSPTKRAKPPEEVSAAEVAEMGEQEFDSWSQAVG